MHEKNVRIIIIAFLLVLFIGMSFVISYPYLFGKHWISSDNVFTFEGVTGPVTVSTVANPQPAQWQEYEQGSSSRLSILLTDTNSAWLGLVHGLKTIGVPFRITTDVDEALNHKVVLVYPMISGKVLASHELKKIANYARTGGNLIGINVLGGGLQSIFGFKSVESSRKHTRVVLHDSHPVMRELADDDFRNIRLSTKEVNDLSFGTHFYREPKHPPLALYNDVNRTTDTRIFSRSYALLDVIESMGCKVENALTDHIVSTFVLGRR